MASVEAISTLEFNAPFHLSGSTRMLVTLFAAAPRRDRF
jgi:hypothetical protein